MSLNPRRNSDTLGKLPLLKADQLDRLDKLELDINHIDAKLEPSLHPTRAE
jgi:hypothetical protein